MRFWVFDSKIINFFLNMNIYTTAIMQIDSEDNLLALRSSCVTSPKPELVGIEAERRNTIFYNYYNSIK